jgi:site-specific DNA-methyltransferase (adenine-specific)
MQTMLNKVICGDSIALLQQLRTESIDLIITDPPYNIGEKYDVHDDKLTTEAYLAWAKVWLSSLYRVLKVDGTFWLVINDGLVSEMDVLAKQIGFFKRSHVIWHYTFGVNCQKKLTPSHAHLLYFTKHKKNFTFNTAAVKVPSARQLVYKDHRAKAGGRLPDDTWVLRPQWFPGAFQSDEDTWTISRVCGTFKERSDTPNQLPERLLGRPIALCSNLGDIVLDPFAGSGTTLSTAKKLGRNYVGFELSPNYTAAANLRVESAKVGESLAGTPQQGDPDATS